MDVGCEVGAVGFDVGLDVGGLVSVVGMIETLGPDEGAGPW